MKCTSKHKGCTSKHSHSGRGSLSFFCPASVVPARQPRSSPWNLCEGEYFVPTSKAVDWGKLGEDFVKFKNKLRWRAHFFLGGKTDTPSDTEFEDVNSSDENLYRCFKLPSDRKATVCKDNALELFLELVERDIFHPDNDKVKFKCNLTTDERNAMRDLVNN